MPSTSSLFFDSTSVPISSPSSPQWRSEMGSGSCSKFIPHCLCCSFFHRKRAPHTLSHRRQSSVNSMSSPHRLQLFMNQSSMDPLHGMQSFRNTLIQHGPHSLASPARKLSTARAPLLSRPRFCQEPAPAQSSHGSQPALWIHLLWSVVLPGLQVDLCLPMALHGLHGTAFLTMVCTTDCRAISDTFPGASPASLYALALLTSGLFLSHILSPLSSD